MTQANFKKGDRVFLLVECIVDDVATETYHPYPDEPIKLVTADFRAVSEKLKTLVHPIGAIWVKEDQLTRIYPVPTED
jgi:hypothetical protein